MHKAKCKACKQIIISEGPGHFVICDCGKSFIDTDRWDKHRIRLGGEAELIKDDKNGDLLK